jgi:hypothetical protein
MAEKRVLERGLLLLADLSGYTAYLARSEPAHGPVIVGDFIETVVGRLHRPFRLEKLEGDAAFLVAPANAVDAAGLIDAVDAAYFAFRSRLRSVSNATSCSCTACAGIPDLDLKFVCHVGDVLRQRIAGREELAGRDVIVAHRLLKAGSAERAGATSYLLVTDAATAALDLDPASLGMVRLTEQYEELGAIRCHLLDLGRRWEAQSTDGPLVPSGRLVTRIERLLPVPPVDAWALLTAPAERMRWEGMTILEEDVPGARGLGATGSCVVDRLRSVEEILDWRPFESFARRIVRPDLGQITALYRLTEMGNGSHLEASWFGGSEADGAAAFAASQVQVLDRLVELAVLRAGVSEASRADAHAYETADSSVADSPSVV